MYRTYAVECPNKNADVTCLLVVVNGHPLCHIRVEMHSYPVDILIIPSYVVLKAYNRSVGYVPTSWRVKSDWDATYM